MEDFKNLALTHTYLHTLQDLWRGYGKIQRYQSNANPKKTVIVKSVSPPENKSNSIGHQRKIRSYQIEAHWYKNYAHLCNIDCRVPAAYFIEPKVPHLTLVLEDLNASGFHPLNSSSMKQAQQSACLSWLAHFHARFIQKKPKGLWNQGSYWHLETRPEEFEKMENSSLKRAATHIDKALKKCTQTLIHGDAKVANFCFSSAGQVAAVDFQYVGAGCGMKDVAYFIGSCLEETSLKQQQEQVAHSLNIYFSILRKALQPLHTQTFITKLEKEWREMFPLAWADFQRFLLGWAPHHKKNNALGQEITRQALDYLKSTPL